MSKYKVVVYIRVDEEAPDYFDSFEEAQDEVDNLEMMNPLGENFYTIEEVDDDDIIPMQLDECDPTDMGDVATYNPNDPVNW